MPSDALSRFPTEFEESMPPFLTDGSLPPGDFRPSLPEFESRFVNAGDTFRRTSIYDGWVRHRTDLISAGVPDSGWQLLNGSFTTAKVSPGDIDIAVEVPVADTTTLKSLRRSDPILRLLQGPLMKAAYSCDAYPIYVLPDADASYQRVTVAAIEYWTKWFGTTRAGTRKGRVWAKTGGLK